MNEHATVHPSGTPDREPTPGTERPDSPTWRGVRALEVLGKRRRFLVDPRSQLRAALLTSIVTLVLLVLLNVSLHATRQRSAAAVLTNAPELRELILAQNRVEFSLVALASFVFLAGVVVVTILETHKTAGAAFNLARHMAAVEAGRYEVRLRLRRSDNLMGLETAFNDMARGLQNRNDREVESLEGYAEACEKLAGPDEAAALAAALRQRAEELRVLGD